MTASKIDIVPLLDRALVKRLDAEDVSPGGIVLPEQAKEKPCRGRVLAVGDGKRNRDGGFHAMLVKRGQEVLFTRYAGHEIKVNGEEYLLIGEDDILGIVSDA